MSLAGFWLGAEVIKVLQNRGSDYTLSPLESASGSEVDPGPPWHTTYVPPPPVQFMVRGQGEVWSGARCSPCRFNRPFGALRARARGRIDSGRGNTTGGNAP